MKAVVWHGVGDIRLEDVADPTVTDELDVIVRLTASAICGTDLHMIRGTMGPMQEGTVLGHEGVGVVEAVGKGVRNLAEGERVVIPSTINCGYCSYCRAGYPSQCDNANPNGKQAGTAFYGGPGMTGPFNGMQAEKVRVPFGNAGLVKLPDDVSDDQALMLSDIFPTGWYGAELAEVGDGDTVAVYGAGPVGQFAVMSAFLANAGRVIVVDRLGDRLDAARRQGAEVVNFDEEDPVETILGMTGGVGVDRVIDAVGVDAEPAEGGERPGEVEEITVDQNPKGDLWQPGQAPTQAADWAVQSVAKAGTIGIVGVYSPTVNRFPIGQAMNRNLTIKMGNCPHRRIIPLLLRRVRAGEVDPARFITEQDRVVGAVEAYEEFDRRQPGWMKVELEPAS